MQDQSFSRALSARPPLYPSSHFQPAPQRSTTWVQPQSQTQTNRMSRERLRQIVIEQIG